jgi:hypothetical protein
MRLPTARILVPAAFLAGSIASLTLNGPLFLRTAGALGWWDFLFGALLFLFPLFAALWLRQNFRRRVDSASRGLSLLAIFCISLAGAASLLPIARANLAARRLLALGYKTETKLTNKVAVWLYSHDLFLEAPVEWHDWFARTIPSQDQFEQGSRLLAICRTTKLNLKCGPQLANLDVLDGLRDLESLRIWGELAATTNTEALGRLPNLRELKIEALCSPKALPPLTHLPKLETLSMECAWRPDLSGLPTLPKLRNLELRTRRGLVSLRGLESLPQLRSLSIKGPDDVPNARLDISAIAATPNLRKLTIWYYALEPMACLEPLQSFRNLSIRYPDGQFANDHLPALPKLRSLTLGNCPGLDLNALARLNPEVGALTLVSTKTPLRLDGLQSLTKLIYLQISSDCALDETNLTAATLNHIPNLKLPQPLSKRLFPKDWLLRSAISDPDEP